MGIKYTLFYILNCHQLNVFTFILILAGFNSHEMIFYLKSKFI